MADATHTPRRAALLVAGLALAAGLTAVSPLGAAMLSPAITLVVAVGFGWFTGDRSVAWVRRVVRGRRVARLRPAPVAAPPRPTWVLPAGVRVAFDLAMRPPPALQR